MARPRPRDHLQAGHLWLNDTPGGITPGRLRGDAPPEARLVQHMSRRFRLAYSDQEDRTWTMRAIAEDCNISLRAVHDLWHGNSWPSVRTIARIEAAIGSQLWGREHLR